MLDTFIISNRGAIVAQARDRVAARTGLDATNLDRMSGIPVFLNQLGDALRLAKSSAVIDHRQIGSSAAQHGRDLLRQGLTIDEVVHDYGDVCQVISELAIEQEMMISGAEFKTLNLCLDDAIAGAVMAFSQQREHAIGAEGAERLGALARALRVLVNTATLTFESVRSGRVALEGKTGVLHARSLIGLRELLDGALAEVRLDAGLATFESISVAELIEEVQVGASLHGSHAEAPGASTHPPERSVQLVVSTTEPAFTVQGDRQALIAAVSSLLHNARKFTLPGTRVGLTVHVTADDVLIDIEDRCGGLADDTASQLARAFAEGGDADRNAVGHGLSLCMRAAKANQGSLRVQNLVGQGCIFSLVLPRVPTPPLSVVAGSNRSTRS